MLLPSLRISGGVKEALRLAEEMQATGIDIAVAALWRSEHELDCPIVPVLPLSSFYAKRTTAPLQYPVLLLLFLWRILRLLCTSPKTRYVLFMTHFSTFPMAWLAPWLDWYCFNQDVEWMFIPDGIGRRLLRRFILATSRRASVITTNAYISGRYLFEDIRPVSQASIWATEFWIDPDSTPIADRDIDVVMLPRRGHMKRLDLYQEALAALKAASIRTAVMTPDSDIQASLAPIVPVCLLRPTNEEMRQLYGRSKIFLLLSDTEGFGLPPLEAMASSCVPLCRDSGGPRIYMDGALSSNLIPFETSVSEIVQRVQALLADPDSLTTLSHIARDRFMVGLNTTATERRQCLATLVNKLAETTSAARQ